ncbi:MAG: ribonuclease III [Peptostreptococcaceae bacterium]|jgi:ribonuclease III|nr:ribonuclease III [Peptostreptococcaceae bacterium]
MVKDIGLNKISKDDVNALNILSLAYIGDSIWEVYVRNYVISKNKYSKVNKLHRESINLVKAKVQADMIKSLKENNMLDDDMLSVVMRGRNSANNPPKNANVQDYNYATGFEAMIGYLYITENYNKLDEIVKFCLK